MLLSLEENFQITQHITHRFNVGGTAVQKLKHPGLPVTIKHASTIIT